MKQWIKDAVVYQIYPRSFQDSNGDGIGDLPGILSRLDYLSHLGINVIWLSPVYPSPNDDNGYDISDYCGIHPDFGTMEDMERLIREANARGIRIVMDLVINHTSDEHPWFQKALQGDPLYRDYYYIRKGKNSRPPNNWTGFFGGCAWERIGQSDEWYLHLFSRKQPDLNYHKPVVLAEIKKVMEFWLAKGVSGFRCDVINIIWKETLRNGRPNLILTGCEHYLSREGAHRILHTLRHDVLDKYDCFTVGETVFVTPQQARDLCEETREELDMLFSFEHMETDQWFVKWFKRRFRPKRLYRALTKWQLALDWNANYLENHDQPRSISRFGASGQYRERSAKTLAILLFSLRGTPYVYQGQELGMTNFDLTSMEEIRDVESKNIYRLAESLRFPQGYRWKMIRRTSRDNARTPMQWKTDAHAGFTTGTPWLKVNDNYRDINAEAECGDPGSVLSFYYRMVSLRKEWDLLKDGSFRPLHIGRNAFVFERVLDGRALQAAVNLSGKPQRVGIAGQVVISSGERETFDGILMPWEGVILSDHT